MCIRIYVCMFFGLPCILPLWLFGIILCFYLSKKYYINFLKNNREKECYYIGPKTCHLLTLGIRVTTLGGSEAISLERFFMEEEIFAVLRVEMVIRLSVLRDS